MEEGESHIKKPNNEVSEVSHAPTKGSIKKRVFALLDKNPLLSTRMICKLLNIDYHYYKKYIYNLRSKWKASPKKEQGSKPSSFHGWRGWTYLPKNYLMLKVGNVRLAAIHVGWKPTKARNRWLLWKDRLGRLMWFETGRVNLWIRKPATLGRAFQIICNAFSYTGLITDMKILYPILKGIRLKGAHYVFDVKQPLPKMTIDFFSKSNGVIIKVGDRTHPTSVEVIASYPDWAESNERQLGKFLEVMTEFIDTIKPKIEIKKPERFGYIS